MWLRIISWWQAVSVHRFDLLQAYATGRDLSVERDVDLHIHHGSRTKIRGPA